MMFIKTIVWLLYLCLFLFTFLVLKHKKQEKMGFSEGVLVGLIYFLALPMFFILFQGFLTADGIFAPAYYPFENLKTTFNIFLGWMTVILATLITGKRSSKVSLYQMEKGKFYFKLSILLYLFFTIYSVYFSGLGSEGSHWHSSVHNAFQESSLFILVKNFAGSFRVMLYGGLLWLFYNKIISLKKFFSIGLIIAIFDLLLTFNRILLVFYFLTMILVLGKYRKYFITSTIVFLPIVAFLSNAWPYFRSTVFSEGFKYDSMVNVWKDSIDNIKDKGLDLSEFLNGIFESSNIVVYNFVVNNFGENIPIYYGYTFILRPLTTFIPSTIWTEKPRVFGTYLGEFINAHSALALNSTLFGEVYANFYMAWPVFLLLFILLFDKLFNYFNSNVPFSNFAGFVIAISLWRFDANFASICIYSIVLLLVLRVMYVNFLIRFLK